MRSLTPVCGLFNLSLHPDVLPLRFTARLYIPSAYLTNPSENSFRNYLTEQSFKQHISRLDEGGQEDGIASADSGVHFTLSRRTPPSTRKSGSTFDPTSPFHFVSRASVSLRTPKHVFYSFGILTIAALYPTGRPQDRTHGHAIYSGNLVSSVSDAWFVGLFGRWWRGGIIQSWWYDMLAATEEDNEDGPPGILNVKALDLLEGCDGELQSHLNLFFVQTIHQAYHSLPLRAYPPMQPQSSGELSDLPHDLTMPHPEATLPLRSLNRRLYLCTHLVSPYRRRRKAAQHTSSVSRRLLHRVRRPRRPKQRGHPHRGCSRTPLRQRRFLIRPP